MIFNNTNIVGNITNFTAEQDSQAEKISRQSIVPSPSADEVKNPSKAEEIDLSSLSLKPEACGRLFQSNVFQSYLSQLNQFVKDQLSSHSLLNSPKAENSFEEQGIKFIQDLLALSQSSKDAESLKQNYQKMIYNLRSLLRQKEEAMKEGRELSRQIRDFLDKFTGWMYTTPYLWDSMGDYLEQEGKLQVETRSTSPSLNIFSTLLEQRVALKETLHLDGIREPTYWDFNAQGDVPSYLFTVPGQKTRVMRMPTITRDVERDPQTKALQKVEVVPEFKNYLSLGKHHLYINLMDRTVGSEQLRSQAIEQLEKDPKVGKAISVITFDKDSDFYHQKNGFESWEISEHFKQRFMEQMFDPTKNQAFYWSDKIDMAQWQNRCIHIIEFVHRNYFLTSLRLTPAERREFIEITYALMTQELIEMLQPDNCNVSCRKCIDRGGSALSLLYGSYLNQQHAPLTTAEAKKLSALALGPAALIENRQPFENRLSMLAYSFHRSSNPQNYQEAEKLDIENTLASLPKEDVEDLKDNVRKYIARKQLNIPKKSLERTVTIAAACYLRSHFLYGTVALKWVDYLLQKANKEGKKIIFMARDGGTPYKIAAELLEKYPERYPKMSKDRIIYGYFSRKIIDNCKKDEEGKKLFLDYIDQLGVQEKDKCLFVDIGFSGSMVDPIKAMVAPLNLDTEFEFLFSLSNKANGFMENEPVQRPARPEYGEPEPFTTFPVNEVGVHWLEDSHQGTVQSPTRLVKIDGKIYPDTRTPNEKKTYRHEPETYLWRKYSQLGAIQIVNCLTPEQEDVNVVKKSLKELLINMHLKHYHIYIPHFSTIEQPKKA